MKLSIVCVTDNRKHASRFIVKMACLAKRLNAEFVLGLDGERAQKSDMGVHADKVVVLPAHDVQLQEKVLDIAVNACTYDYVLRLDDDEAVSPALENWLLSGVYTSGNLFAFPRVYMWDNGILANEGIYPDLQTRLGRKALMTGYHDVHSGNPNGTGTVVPFAIEHHSLIVKTYAERKEIAERYDAIRPGAGSHPVYARYLLPEDVYGKLIVKPYAEGDYSK